jgi:hypothetical protein
MHPWLKEERRNIFRALNILYADRVEIGFSPCLWIWSKILDLSLPTCFIICRCLIFLKGFEVVWGAVINSTAKVASLPFTVSQSVSRNIHRGLPHHFWQQHRLWASTTNMNLSMVPSGSMYQGNQHGPVLEPGLWAPFIAVNSSPAHGHQQGFWWQHRPRVSAWPSLVMVKKDSKVS